MVRVMSTQRGSQCGGGPVFPRYAVYLVFCLLLLTVFPGCGGCWSWRPWRSKTLEELEKEREEIAKREEEKKKRKEDFVPGPVVAYPYVSRLIEFEGPRPKNRDLEQSLLSEINCLYKPGHWTGVTFAAKANNFDFVGDLEIGVLNQDGGPMLLPGMPFSWTGWRTIALPKGQAKVCDAAVFIPSPGANARLDCAIHAKNRGHRVFGVPAPYHNLMRMPAYQYHLVVLAQWSQRYSYLKGADSVRSPLDVTINNPERAYYRVTLLEPGRQVPLPGQSLFWTSIAYLFWDEVAPELLRPDQQEALLDWLHWGGQLIISGPGTLDSLGNSFLGSYLPATAKGTRPIAAADLTELNGPLWSVGVPGRAARKLNPARPWTGIRWQKHPEAEFLPHTGDLLVERRVGRGRIVVSAFPLHGAELTGWPGFDGFLNACLLRRPPRVFRDNQGQIQTLWADDRGGELQLDARRVCNLRYFTRDSGRTFVQPKEAGTMIGPAPPADPTVRGNVYSPVPMVEVEPVYGSDVASWTDFNAVANAARESLQNAARIEIPGPSFVVWVVAGYLLVLVPLNWLVFRALGRVEWAWVAAPIIALACTLLVIHLAQLDIGFLRSLTELAVVETHGGYQRAHVTRYAAMYTSLSTRYTLRMEDPGGQMQPFPTVDDPAKLRMLVGQTPAKLQYTYGKDVSLRGLEVSSNSTGLVHAEQMLDLGGSISLTETPAGGFQVANRTGLTLQGTGVVRKDGEGNVQTAWIGAMGPEATAFLRYRPRPAVAKGQSVWETERATLMAGLQAEGKPRLDLSRLFGLAESPDDLASGEVRLVAWVDAHLPGLEIQPVAPQKQQVALVIVHLRPGNLAPPKPDAQSRIAVDPNRPRILTPETTP